MAKTLDEAGVKRLIQEIKGANKNLNTAIPISTENTPESKAQNVKNIADYVEKAKAAGIANVDGMGVTCIIDGDYSGAGYLYGEDMICGITTYNDLATPYNFAVQSDGLYIDNPFIVKGTTGQVTSSMLAMGARKPIILTPSTTEVDEETYQKLLSDDVDVLLKSNDDGYCQLTYKFNGDTACNFYFTVLSAEGGSFEDTYLYGYHMSINNTAPHKVTFELLFNTDIHTLIDNSGFINKSTLSPVLQEIDLSGTDADRKAKLDYFETYWKALTDASDLTGARFVGYMCTLNGSLSTIFAWNSISSYYEGAGTDDVGKIYKIQVDPSDGNIHFTPLFSHLEAITIKTGNTPGDKAANIAAIKAYVDNLTALGVDVTKGWTAPVKVYATNGISCGMISNTGEDSSAVYTMLYGLTGQYPYVNYVNKTTGATGAIGILTTGSYSTLTTTSKQIVNAINEVNALAKGYSTIFTPIELTTETAQNKTAIDARVAAFTAQGISLTNGCCIPVTYKGVYAGNISFINGDWYGLLVKNTNNPADNINIKLSADGTIAEGNSAQ